MRTDKEQEQFDAFIGAMRKLPPVKAPGGLADEIIRQARDTTPASVVRFHERSRGRTLFALAAALLILAGGVFYYRTRYSPDSLAAGRTVRFEIAFADAQTVTLVGDFNKWDKGASPLRQREDGKWVIEVKLAPGCYQYQFLVNGTLWSPDPQNPDKIDDGFGGFNSGLEI
jgi:hypothetical protein